MSTTTPTGTPVAQADVDHAALPARGRAVLAVAANDLRRLRRDRVALFFVAVLPFILIVAIGSFVPPAEVDLVLGVVQLDDSDAADDLVGAIDDAPGVQLELTPSRREAERDARLGRFGAVVVVPDDFGEQLATGVEPGAVVEVSLDPSSSTSTLVRSTLGEILGEQASALTVASVIEERGATADEAGQDATAAIESVGTGSVVVERVDGSRENPTTYAHVAAGQMVLFMFVNCLAAGAGYAEMRRNGVLARMLAGPTDAGDVLTGSGLGRFAMTTGLAAAVVVLSMVVYDVDWGSWAVVVSVVALFGLVSSAAGGLVGAAVSRPEMAISVGIPVAMAMAALGGCMFPLSFAPDALQVAAKVFTPHAWAVGALDGASYDGETLADLWLDMAVLAAWAVALSVIGRGLARRRLRDG